MSTKTKFILFGFLGISWFFLYTEHRAHLYGWLPYGLLLLCPLMHVFMHGGHDHSNHEDHPQNTKKDKNI